MLLPAQPTMISSPIVSASLLLFGPDKHIVGHAVKDAVLFAIDVSKSMTAGYCDYLPQPGNKQLRKIATVGFQKNPRLFMLDTLHFAQQ